jgi:hypothetical protein
MSIHGAIKSTGRRHLDQVLLLVVRLITASTASIPVLHSPEVVPFTHKSCYSSATGLYRPHTPLPRNRDNVTLRGLYKVPLASKTRYSSRKSNAGIPRLTAITAKSTREPPYMPTPLLPLPLSSKVVLH